MLLAQDLCVLIGVKHCKRLIHHIIVFQLHRIVAIVPENEPRYLRLNVHFERLPVCRR